jgi:2-(1,2-epoxy-1,2-dihydrophenyl)acetyl-CoA isomerase
MSEPGARLRIADGVAVIAFDDPATLNAIGRAMRRDIARALEAIEGPGSGARCLLLTGEGRAFSSGANLAEADEPDRDVGASLREWYNPTLLRLRDLPMPIVAAVNGPAAGIGMSFALAADIVLAARTAYFLQAFARIGLVPDGGASWVLPRRIGFARAIELAMLAEKLPAETALAWGLINRVVDDGALMAEATGLARRLAQGPTRSYALLRRLYWASLENGYAEQLALEAETQAQAGRTADHREGVRAFLEKRAARFGGA